MRAPRSVKRSNNWGEWASAVLAHRVFIVVLTASAGGIAFGLCRIMPPLYTAEAVIVANRNEDTLSLTGLYVDRGKTPIRDPFSLTMISSYYAELLRSDSLLRPLADVKWKNGLSVVEIYRIEERPGLSVDRQVMDLLRNQFFNVEQDMATGMLTVQCSTFDPTVSAEMANALIENLKAFLEENRTSGTGTLLRMAQAHTSETALQLQRAEDVLREFRNRNKTIVSPDLRLREARLQRDVKVHEELFIKLKTEIDLLRISRQQKTEPVVLLQPAALPLRKSWPSTGSAVLGASVFGMVFGIAVALVRHGIKKAGNQNALAFARFVMNLRAATRFLPGLILLLPARARRVGRTSVSAGEPRSKLQE